jgi:hypothetical protein
VVLVVDEQRDHAGRCGREERLPRPGGVGGGAQGGDVGLDGRGVRVGDRAPADGDDEVAGRGLPGEPLGVLREAVECLVGAGLALDRLQPGDPRPHVRDVADLAELAVVDDVNARLHLPAHAPGDGVAHRGRVELGPAALALGDGREQVSGTRQAPGVRRPDRHADLPPGTSLTCTPVEVAPSSA